MKRPIQFLLALVALTHVLFAAEVIPPPPARYFNDYAEVTSARVQSELNSKLEELEKTDSTQIIVAIFKKMQSESSVEDYTVRVAQKWGVGQKEKSNGAVLFVFVEDRAMYVQVGYGLEGSLPDITAKDITENRIKPFFRDGNYDAGLSAGVDALIQAARGEYKGTGRTNAQAQRRRNGNGTIPLFIILFFVMMGFIRRRRQGHEYRSTGRRGWGGPIIWPGGGGSGFGGGGGWGGGFSGGGGGFGGGGAGSKW